MSYYRDVGTPHMGSMAQDTRGPRATLNTGVGRVTLATVALGICPRTQSSENPYLTHREGLPEGADRKCPTQAGTLQDILSCLRESLLPVALNFLHLGME